jgi:molybdopterin converting factor small subunit
MATIKLFGALRDRAKTGLVRVEGEKTLLGILEHLAELYGPEVRNLLLEEKDGKLQKRLPVVILINGISQIDLVRIVGDGETITIFPAVAGG